MYAFIPKASRLCALLRICVTLLTYATSLCGKNEVELDVYLLFAELYQSSGGRVEQYCQGNACDTMCV